MGSALAASCSSILIEKIKCGAQSAAPRCYGAVSLFEGNSNKLPVAWLRSGLREERGEKGGMGGNNLFCDKGQGTKIDVYHSAD